LQKIKINICIKLIKKLNSYKNVELKKLKKMNVDVKKEKEKRKNESKNLNKSKGKIF